MRAIAVLAVVWFHSGLPGVPGGFVRIDIFFVISGYLMTGIIDRERRAGSFGFAHFYQRRFRRIAPALVVMLAATMAAGHVLMLPAELIRLGKSTIAALLMVPNLHYWWSDAGGYFGLARHVAPPLLHTWSLGVEEQFYLIFPSFLLVAAKLRAMRPAIVVVALGSFALWTIGTHRAWPSAFFLLPPRAWEVALGALLGIGVIRLPARLGTVALVVGLAMIVDGCLWLKPDGDQRFWLAAMPALGAALVVGSGPATICIGPRIAAGRCDWADQLFLLPMALANHPSLTADHNVIAPVLRRVAGSMK